MWAEEVGRFERSLASLARAARTAIERPGARIPILGCEPHGPDGTRLPGCAKVYVPLETEPSRAPYAFVFQFVRRDDPGVLEMELLAFGERHPRAGSRSVYDRAHRRLHGRYPPKG